MLFVWSKYVRYLRIASWPRPGGAWCVSWYNMVLCVEDKWRFCVLTGAFVLVTSERDDSKVMTVGEVTMGRIFTRNLQHWYAYLFAKVSGSNYLPYPLPGYPGERSEYI